jgi:hypothetical protein
MSELILVQDHDEHIGLIDYQSYADLGNGYRTITHVSWNCHDGTGGLHVYVEHEETGHVLLESGVAPLTAAQYHALTGRRPPPA